MLEKFERYPLTFGPSPIEKLSRLSEHLGGQVEIYTKREDCNSGLVFGGNKIRKLEYIVPDAIASNGEAAVAAVVDQFVANNNADEVISHRWETTNEAELKEYLAELICQATGGPCVYTGKPMDVAHAGLDVTDSELGRVAANLVNALDKFNVPAKEKDELLAIVSSLRDQVVGQ